MIRRSFLFCAFLVVIGCGDASHPANNANVAPNVGSKLMDGQKGSRVLACSKEFCGDEQDCKILGLVGSVYDNTRYACLGEHTKIMVDLVLEAPMRGKQIAKLLTAANATKRCGDFVDLMVEICPNVMVPLFKDMNYQHQIKDLELVSGRPSMPQAA